MTQVINREDWLTRCAMILNEEMFKPSGYDVPQKVRYATSLPSHRAFGAKSSVIGQCFPPALSTDGHVEIFISPTIDDQRLVVGTLLHEMVHAVVGCEEGHNKVFKRCALEVGLEGKMTATTLGDNAWKYLEPIVTERIGAYPHARITKPSTKKKQSTRMIKAECLGTGYTVRLSRKWIDEYGQPKCPCCDILMAVQ